MIVLSTFVFAIVMVMFGYAIWKFRAKPGDESDGEPIHGNTKLEIAWTVIPTIIVLFGRRYSWIVLDDIEAKADDQMPLKSPRSSSSGHSSTRTPTGCGRTCSTFPSTASSRSKLEALDVIHSFWVPEWRIKRPRPSGRRGDEIDDEFVVTPNEEGTFSLVCTELCGLGHDDAATVVVGVAGRVRPVDRRASQAQAAPSGSSAAGGT